MPDRWLSFLTSIFPHPKTFAVTLASSAASVWGVVSQENAVAITFAVVAIGTALGPPTQKALKWYRDFQRAEDAEDRKQLTGEFAAEVRAKLALEDKVEKLTDQVEKLTTLCDKQARQIASLSRQNTQQAAEQDVVKAEVVKIKGVTIDNREKVKEQAQRIETLERTTGSSDNISAT